MTVQDCCILTLSQRNAAVALNDDSVGLAPNEITNPLADNLGIKEQLGVSTLVGMFTLPARWHDTPGYERWQTLLGSLQIRTIDDTTTRLPETL